MVLVIEEDFYGMTGCFYFCVLVNTLYKKRQCEVQPVPPKRERNLFSL